MVRQNDAPKNIPKKQESSLRLPVQLCREPDAKSIIAQNKKNNAILG